MIDNDTVEYDCVVTVKFHFTVEAEDDMKAEELALYGWQDNVYHSEVHKVRVEAIEPEEEDEEEDE